MSCKKEKREKLEWVSYQDSVAKMNDACAHGYPSNLYDLSSAIMENLYYASVHNEHLVLWIFVQVFDRIALLFWSRKTTHVRRL
jgi:hypothetical protein